MHILFEDYHCLAVNKPAGLLTQAPPGIPSLEAMVRAYIKEKYHKPGNVYLGIPHRLDRPVSGVIVFARNTKAAQRLAEQFQKHQVEKVYWALVQGELAQESGTMEDWLRKLPEQARTEIAAEGELGAKKAVLEYRCLEQVPGGTLLEIRPRTGRSHQIRVQLASRGHPVWGDELYGSSIPFGPPAELPRDRIIALHAHSLAFVHPTKREPITVTAPLPEYWPALHR
ncbi:MAG TPA: RluA family pseudouridine synthase [Gemmataceae bacterium]|jgi:23S rRNA pseudouridine1911/1915/1917 synthase|nr:RluA family pseudouridine synthase [Gemmataceae bacterium]